MLKAKTVAFFLICVLLYIVIQNWNKGIRGINLCDILRETLVRGLASARAEDGVTVLQDYTRGTARLKANTWKRVRQCIPVMRHSQNTFLSFSNLQFIGFQKQMFRDLYVMTFDRYTSGNAWLFFEWVYTSSAHTTPGQGIPCNHLALHWIRRYFLFLLFEVSLLLIWHADQIFSWETSQTANTISPALGHWIFRNLSLSSYPFPNWRVLVLVRKMFHTLIAFTRPLLILFCPFWVKGAEQHTASLMGVCHGTSQGHTDIMSSTYLLVTFNTILAFWKLLMYPHINE